jgi:hypothetical protein
MLTQPVCSRFRRKVVSQARCALRGQVVRPKARCPYIILRRALRKARAHSAAKSEKRLAIEPGGRHNQIIIGIGLGADGRETACAPAEKRGDCTGLGAILDLSRRHFLSNLIESIDLAVDRPGRIRTVASPSSARTWMSRHGTRFLRAAGAHSPHRAAPTEKAGKMSHRFRPGQSVRFCHGSLYRDAAGGSYEVIRQLPQDDGDYQYRIKSAREQHERVVKERELERA